MVHHGVEGVDSVAGARAPHVIHSVVSGGHSKPGPGGVLLHPKQPRALRHPLGRLEWTGAGARARGWPPDDGAERACAWRSAPCEEADRPRGDVIGGERLLLSADL